MTTQATTSNIGHIITNLSKSSGTLKAAKFAASALTGSAGVTVLLTEAQAATRKNDFLNLMFSIRDFIDMEDRADDVAAITADLNDEARRNLTASDVETMHRMTQGNTALCRVAARNFQRGYPEDVNPLGYLMHRNGEICKIESIYPSDDGEVWNINVFDIGSRIYTELSRNGDMVNWFMPEAAPEFDAQDTRIMMRDAVDMVTTAITQRINPHNFAGMLDEVAEQYTVRKYMQKVWCDFGDEAIKAVQWEPKRYASRQAALDSGDYDSFRSMAGGVLSAEIERGLVVIGEADALIHGFDRQTLEAIARGDFMPQDEQTIRNLAAAVLAATGDK